MSRWNRPMREYHPIVPKCFVCHKPMSASVFDSTLNAYRHPYDCTKPKTRPSKEERARLRRAAGVEYRQLPMTSLVEISAEFYNHDPEIAETEALQLHEKMKEARGPRGGHYRLGPVLSVAIEYRLPLFVRSWAKRKGTYVRPSRMRDLV